MIAAMAFRIERHPLSPSITSIALRVSLVLLIFDAIIELFLVCSSLGWLGMVAKSHKYFRFTAYGSKHNLAALPRNFLNYPTQICQIAAGTAVFFVGVIGLICLWLRNLTQYRIGQFAKGCRCSYYTWVILLAPSLVLTTAALACVFAEASRPSAQIDTALAVELNGSQYDRGTWGPQSWLSAVLGLQLVHDREDIVKQLMFIKGWQYNIIPMFILQFIQFVLGVMDLMRWNRKPRHPETWSRF
ncbi:hypothetical protein F5Y08DRAFT_352309 [Xylaria arbuscula]|nr:hypothetical protein F5Y08DRAFT_352309 [Xylaria arbuscula]